MRPHGEPKNIMPEEIKLQGTRSYSPFSLSGRPKVAIKVELSLMEENVGWIAVLMAKHLDLHPKSQCSVVRHCLAVAPPSRMIRRGAVRGTNTDFIAWAVTTQTMKKAVGEQLHITRNLWTLNLGYTTCPILSNFAFF